MIRLKNPIRIILFISAAGAVVFAGYRLVADKMASTGTESLARFYMEQMLEPLIHFELEWALAGYALGVTFLALVSEILILGWSNSSLRRIVRIDDKSTGNNIFYRIVGTLRLGGLLRIVLTLGAASIVAYAIRQLDYDISLVDRIESPFLKYLFAFLVLDFLGYFQHRLAHSWGWWWELHKIHHSAEKFNMVTYYRTHVLESIPRAVILGIALSITGDLASLIFYYALLELISLFVHSEVQYKWGWLEKYLLVSPRNHKIHHSIDPKHHDKNFGFTLIVWDRLFGTFYEPRDGEAIEIGLRNNPFNKSNPVADLLLAYRNCLSTACRSIVGTHRVDDSARDRIAASGKRMNRAEH